MILIKFIKVLSFLIILNIFQISQAIEKKDAQTPIPSKAAPSQSNIAQKVQKSSPSKVTQTSPKVNPIQKKETLKSPLKNQPTKPLIDLKTGPNAVSTPPVILQKSADAQRSQSVPKPSSQTVMTPINTSPKSTASPAWQTVGKKGDLFNQAKGQCVGYIETSRPDLGGKTYGSAAQMIPKLQETYVINKNPAPGSVLVLPKVHQGDGHVELVTKVQPDPQDPNVYILTVRDANSRNDYKEGKGSSIDERTVKYYRNEGKVIDPNMSKSVKQEVGGFIQGKKSSQESNPGKLGTFDHL